MKPRHFLIAALALAAGCLAALAVVKSAYAFDPGTMPQGFSVYVHGEDSSAQTCPEWYRIRDDNSTPATISGNLCSQADVQAWIKAAPQAPPPPATTTTAAPTTTTAPAATTTAPASTTPAPAPTTTTTTTAPAPTPTTTTTPAPATATPPYADFTAALVNPNTVAFTDATTAGSSAVTTHTWQFGDGQAGTGINPSHAYGAPGNYNVTEITVDANGLTSIAVHALALTVTSATLGPRQTAAAHTTTTQRKAKHHAKKPITKKHKTTTTKAKR